MTCVKIKSAPGTSACLYLGEYRLEGAIPLIKEAEVDLSLVYGMWFEKTQVPPNTSIIITDGARAYAAYVLNSPATVLFEVPNAAEYAASLVRALERTPYGFYIDYAAAALVEEEAKKTVKLYNVEEVRREVEALKRRSAARHDRAAEPPREAALGVEPPAEPPRGVVLDAPALETPALDARPPPSAFLRRAEAPADLCAKLDERLRELGLSLAEFYRLLGDEKFKAALREIVQTARA